MTPKEAVTHITLAVAKKACYVFPTSPGLDAYPACDLGRGSLENFQCNLEVAHVITGQSIIKITLL